MANKRVDFEMQTGEFKSDIRLAKFYRYGYWICAFIIALLFECVHLLNLGFWCGLFMIIHRIYAFIIMQKPERHFILAMLDADRKEMKLSGGDYDMFMLEKWRREERIFSFIFIILGLACIILSFFN